MKTRITFIALAGLFLLLPVEAAAHPATGIVLDRAGNIYFSDLETVWKINAAGKLSVFRAGVSGRHVHELAIDTQDNIYGADVSYEPSAQKFISDVWMMSPDGAFQYLLEPTHNPPRGMSMWRDREGNNYSIDQNNHTKTQTLLLRRALDGKVITLAGSSYGHADGKGTAARFSSVGNMAFSADGSIYLTDGSSVRKVAMDGTVITLAKGLDFRTRDDKPTLFGGAYGNLAGLNVNSAGTVFVADAGNRRLFKIDRDGKVDVVLRTDPPYFPNGVVTAHSGDIYVLEVGFTLPSAWSGPRVRKLTADGKSTILATVGAESGQATLRGSVARSAGTLVESFLSFFYRGGLIKNSVIILSVSILCMVAIVWQRRRRQRA